MSLVAIQQLNSQTPVIQLANKLSSSSQHAKVTQLQPALDARLRGNDIQGGQDNLTRTVHTQFTPHAATLQFGAKKPKEQKPSLADKLQDTVKGTINGTNPANIAKAAANLVINLPTNLLGAVLGGKGSCCGIGCLRLPLTAVLIGLSIPFPPLAIVPLLMYGRPLIGAISKTLGQLRADLTGVNPPKTDDNGKK